MQLIPFQNDVFNSKTNCTEASDYMQTLAKCIKTLLNFILYLNDSRTLISVLIHSERKQIVIFEPYL